MIYDYERMHIHMWVVNAQDWWNTHEQIKPKLQKAPVWPSLEAGAHWSFVEKSPYCFWSSTFIDSQLARDLDLDCQPVSHSWGVLRLQLGPPPQGWRPDPIQKKRLTWAPWGQFVFCFLHWHSGQEKQKTTPGNFGTRSRQTLESLGPDPTRP